MAVYREACNLGGIIKVLLGAVLSLGSAGKGLLYCVIDCFSNNLVYNKVTSNLAESVDCINSLWNVY